MKSTQAEIYIAEYDDNWPAVFAGEAADVMNSLGDLAAEIHHIGSTAVPGLGAKTVIDIMVGMNAPLLDAQVYLEHLAPLGYSHLEVNDPGRHFYLKGSPRTHHLHLAVTDGWHYWRYLLFRDKLVACPSTAQAYELLKRQSAEKYPNDRENYTLSKTDFITDTVIQILKGHPSLAARLRDQGAPIPEFLPTAVAAANLSIQES